jgi:hypothetical protein
MAVRAFGVEWLMENLVLNIFGNLIRIKIISGNVKFHHVHLLPLGAESSISKLTKEALG